MSLDSTTTKNDASHLIYKKPTLDIKKLDSIDMMKDVLSGDTDLLAKWEANLDAMGGVETLQTALKWLQEADPYGDYKQLIANEGWRLTYRRRPPTPEEFLTYEWIGPQCESLWPNIKKCFIEFLDPNPLNPARNMALSTSIGWGKSLLTNLILSYIIVLFGLMRKPYQLLGHSQPVYEKIKLPNGSYTTIDDLRVGMKVAGVTQQESTILDIIDQGTKVTYELTFENNLTCRCSMDHLWTVWDTKQNKYVVLPTKVIVDDMAQYLFPEQSDCIKDRDLILAAEAEFFKA